jgi:hypothetical protein
MNWKKGQGSRVGTGAVCACKRRVKEEQSEHVCVIQWSKVNCAFKVRCEETTR